MKDRMNELLLGHANWQSILVEAFDQTVMIMLKVEPLQHAIVIVTSIVMNVMTDFKCLTDTAKETLKPELTPDAADGRANESVSTTSVIRHIKKRQKYFSLTADGKLC